MGVSRTVIAGVAAATVLAASATGCGAKEKSGSAPAANTPHSATAAPRDYTGLLIQASDIKAPEDFTAAPPTKDPNGQPGAATTYSTQDGDHVIKTTIQVLADPAAATTALNAAKKQQGNAIKKLSTGTANVGSGGTTLSGNTTDGSKGVLILLFTQGKALVTIEFFGPAHTLPPDDFVNDVGTKQAAAVKSALGG